MVDIERVCADNMLRTKHCRGKRLVCWRGCFFQCELIDCWIIQLLSLHIIYNLDDLFDTLANIGVKGKIGFRELMMSHRAVEVCHESKWISDLGATANQGDKIVFEEIKLIEKNDQAFLSRKIGEAAHLPTVEKSIKCFV